MKNEEKIRENGTKRKSSKIEKSKKNIRRNI